MRVMLKTVESAIVVGQGGINVQKSMVIQAGLPDQVAHCSIHNPGPLRLPFQDPSILPCSDPLQPTLANPSIEHPST
jgi:hypothetical protein